MTESSSLARTASDKSTPRARNNQASWFYPLILRLHFYIGLLIGPFIFFAALSGGLYAISPQIENVVYAEALTGQTTGTPHSLTQQIAAARQSISRDLSLAAVRPAPEPGKTTRVMFTDPGLGQYEHRAIFIDPVTLDVKGNMAVYGTSGSLPLRSWIDYLHRNLNLGEPGRIYSELAASWLWVAALGGLTLWHLGRRKRKRSAALHTSDTTPAGKRRGRHVTLGLTLLLGFLFLSVTGLTWSRWAGGHIADLRAALDWGTPSVDRRLEGTPIAQSPTASKIDQQTFDARFDGVLAAARNAGIDAGKLEIQASTDPQRAWRVREINRSWPTQVDSVAVDPRTLKVVDQANFTDFPVAAKLTRWGIDMHMGILFGLANQLMMLGLALGLCTMIVWGYRMWWTRRPLPRSSSASQATRLTTHWLRAPRPARLLIVVFTVALGWALPALGVSLAIFLVLDICLVMNYSRKADSAPA